MEFCTQIYIKGLSPTVFDEDVIMQIAQMLKKIKNLLVNEIIDQSGDTETLLPEHVQAALHNVMNNSFANHANLQGFRMILKYQLAHSFIEGGIIASTPKKPSPKKAIMLKKTPVPKKAVFLKKISASKKAISPKETFTPKKAITPKKATISKKTNTKKTVRSLRKRAPPEMTPPKKRKRTTKLKKALTWKQMTASPRKKYLDYSPKKLAVPVNENIKRTFEVTSKTSSLKRRVNVSSPKKAKVEKSKEHKAIKPTINIPTKAIIELLRTGVSPEKLPFGKAKQHSIASPKKYLKRLKSGARPSKIVASPKKKQIGKTKHRKTAGPKKNLKSFESVSGPSKIVEADELETSVVVPQTQYDRATLMDEPVNYFDEDMLPPMENVIPSKPKERSVSSRKHHNFITPEDRHKDEPPSKKPALMTSPKFVMPVFRVIQKKKTDTEEPKEIKITSPRKALKSVEVVAGPSRITETPKKIEAQKPIERKIAVSSRKDLKPVESVAGPSKFASSRISASNKGQFDPYAPPRRWLHCPRKGQLIAGIFMPFKTPLSGYFKVLKGCTFTPSMMINEVAYSEHKMGLWIDLTNTTRFYNKNNIENADIKYFKLPCKGHNECPTPDQIEVFIKECQQFLEENPSQIIGVHCTHGFNRTGYLIAAYLIECLSWSVEDAVNEFAIARPPGIFKQDYLIRLFERYGNVDDTFLAPPLPAWCNEDDNIPGEGVPILQNIANKMPNKLQDTFQKKKIAFMEGVPGVIPVDDIATISHVQRKCQAMCRWKGSGFPGSQPVSMDVYNMKLLKQNPYQVSWKADGRRYMMLIEDENHLYFIDRTFMIFQVSNLQFPRRRFPLGHIFDTLLDGEMVIDKINGIDVPRYLIFDIVQFEGNAIGNNPFHIRSSCIEKEIITPRSIAMNEGRIIRSDEPFGIRQKPFWDIIHTKQILEEEFQQKVHHKIDGLIFQPVISHYHSGTAKEILKWKPTGFNSIDFRLRITKEQGEGIIPTLIGNLFVGGSNTPFAQIKLNKELKELDGKIIECYAENKQWNFFRERTDRTFPNSFETATSIMNSIKYPITSRRLIRYIKYHRYDLTLQQSPNLMLK